MRGIAEMIERAIKRAQEMSEEELRKIAQEESAWLRAQDWEETPHVLGGAREILASRREDARKGKK